MSPAGRLIHAAYTGSEFIFLSRSFGGVKIPTLNYKGFDICPASQQYTGSGWWTLRVLIENRTGDNKFAAFFDAPNTFPGKVEAEKQSVFFGKKIIDGEVPGYSVEGLT